MASKSMFGVGQTNVNVNLQGSRQMRQEAANIANAPSKFTNYAGVLGNVAKVKGQVNKINQDESDYAIKKEKAAAKQAKTLKTLEGNKAKVYWNTIKSSVEFAEASNTGKAEMLEVGRDRATRESKAFQDGWINATASASLKYNIGREEDSQKSTLNIIYDSKVQWDAEEGDLQGAEGPTATNYQKQMPIDKFVDQYIIDHPEFKDNRGDVNKAVLKGEYSEMGDEVELAGDRVALKDAETRIREIKSRLQSPQFLLTKSLGGKEVISQLEKELNNRITTKKREFLIEDKNSLQGIKDTGYKDTIEQVTPLLSSIAYDDKTGLVDETKLRVSQEKYVEEKIEHDGYVQYMTSQDATLPLTKTQKENKLIGKQHKTFISNTIVQDFLEGNEEHMADVIRANDNSLGDAKIVLVNSLLNTNPEFKKNSDLSWAKFSDTLESPTGYINLKTVLGDEMTYLAGVNIATTYGGKNRDEAIELVNKWKSNPDSFKIEDKDIQREMMELKKNYGVLNNEFMSMVSMAMAGGAEQKTAVREVSKLFDERIVDVGGTPGFIVSGSMPKPSTRAKDDYNQVQTDIVEAFKSAYNSDNPVRVDVLNGGWIVIKDDIFGTKVGPAVNLTEILAGIEIDVSSKGNTVGDELSVDVDRAVGTMSEGISSFANAEVFNQFQKQINEPVGEAMSEAVEIGTTAVKELGKNIEDWVTGLLPDRYKEALYSGTTDTSSMSKETKDAVSAQGVTTIIPNNYTAPAVTFTKPVQVEDNGYEVRETVSRESWLKFERESKGMGEAIYVDTPTGETLPDGIFRVQDGKKWLYIEITD